MIEILRKEDCVGCNACVQRCPKTCINMHRDEQGFLYPKVDIDTCINCGLCNKVCPVINQNEPKIPDKTYAGWNEDETVRKYSSSGGVFFAVAKKIIKEGGVVFGAKFNDMWEVVHSYTETIEGIKVFQGSKYVQSDIGRSFIDAEIFLRTGRKVLYSGTPCQIAGLKRFLRKDYGELLITLDVVCHGTPSPRIWMDYLHNIKHSYSSIPIEEPFIERISFRDKREGWEKYGISICLTKSKDNHTESHCSPTSTGKRESELFERFTDNLYMRGFLKDLYLRPSCYECPAKCGKSHSDITLADFWGIGNKYPELHSDKGVSLILANTSTGEALLSELPIEIHPVKYMDALAGNPAIESSAIKPNLYNLFWYEYRKVGLPAIHNTILLMRPSIFIRGYRKIRYLLGRMLKHN